MLRHKSVLGAAIAISLLPVTASATNGYFTHGIGVRSLAVAGVGVALPQDGLAAALNPAGIARLDNRLDLGVSWFRPSRGAEITGNFAGANGRFDGNDTEDFLIPELGYVRHLSDSLTAGVAVYGNGGMNTDYGRNPFAPFGSTGSAGVNLEQLFITPSLAYELNERNSVGVAVSYAYQRFEMKGVGAFDNPFFSATPGRVSNQGEDSGNGWGLKLGWLGQITSTLSLGASWSSEIDMEEFSAYRGLFAEQGGFDIPSTYSLGLSWQAAPALTLAADWQKILYSEVPSVGNPLQNLLTGNPLGSDNGGGFGWNDIAVIKLGAVYAYSDSVTLRAGISRADQPIPRSETFFNILAPGTVRDHLSLGASWKRSERGEWSISYTHAFRESVRGLGSIPMPFGGGEANVHLKEDVLTVGYSFSL
ncbi:MAG: outer membrane protein transport protein [Pseudomonadales bacterium]|nr:outer membrane protein transport protein [Pseudomonadales bacterium]MCP5358515.1 outer membrane protein transport protein [Pseudomonadales bacterium]